MDKLHEIAVFCVGRAVMFASLGIFCVMFAFSFNPAWAFRAGAIMTLGLAAILVGKAVMAGSKQPRKTEVWLYLEEKSRPRTDHAERYFSQVLREVYASFAKVCLLIACGMFGISIILSLIGFQLVATQAAAY